MSAIKKYFDEERARSRRIMKIGNAKVHPVAPIYVVDQAKLDKAYSDILNWNMNFPEELEHYYQCLDQEEYEYILRKRNEFPSDVRLALWSPPIFKLGNVSKLKVVDFTETMYMNQKAKEQRDFNNRVDTEVAKYDIPDRPSDERDSQLETFRTQLKDQEEELEKLMKAPTKKYVAPSMRKQVMLSDPDVQRMQAHIEKTKNEISLYEGYIADADNGWRRLKQLEFRDQVIQEMLAV